MMWNQIKLLTKINLCNIGGLNQIRYGHNPKEKKRAVALAAVFVILGLICISYAAGLSYGFIMLGMEEMLPPYLMTVISLLILFFSIYKAGNLIFEPRTYEMLSSLPLSPASIVLGRFSTMYLQNLLLSAGVIIPSVCVYGICLKPSIFFYIEMSASIFLIPLLPMTLAVAVGAVITAISSRMKHKNLVSIILTMLLVLGIIILSLRLSTSSDTINNEAVQNFARTIESQLYKIYPPARLFALSVNDHNITALFEYLLLSVIPFAVLIYIVQHYFASICTALNSRTAGKNYEMTKLKQQNPIVTLYKKELLRYFASPLYVLNTSMGYILILIAAVALLITGTTKFEILIGYKGIVGKALPFLMAAMYAITSTTSSSISMEGKNWWIAQSLPIPSKSLFDAKILVNLTIAVPCYAITQILLIFAVNVTVFERLAIIFIPLLYILFVSVAGITINRKMPVFQWTADSAVIKSSAATITMMLTGAGSVLIPAVCLFIPKIPANLVTLLTLAVIGTITVILYLGNNRVDLRSIGE